MARHYFNAPLWCPLNVYSHFLYSIILNQTQTRNAFSFLTLSKHVIFCNISFLVCNGHKQSNDDQCFCNWLHGELSDLKLIHYKKNNNKQTRKNTWCANVNIALMYSYSQCYMAKLNYDQLEWHDCCCRRERIGGVTLFIDFQARNKHDWLLTPELHRKIVL